MNKIVTLVTCIGFIGIAECLFGEMSPDLQKTRDFFKKSCQLTNLSKKIIQPMPKGLANTLAKDTLGGITNISNMGLNIVDFIGERKLAIDGNEINIDVLTKRFDCLLKDDATLKTGAKGYKTDKGVDLKAGCPGVGCVNTDACFALAMRDTVYLMKPIIENLVGKVVLDPQTGESTGQIEKGLFLNFNDVMVQILDVLTQKKAVVEEDIQESAKIAKSQKFMGSFASSLESIKKLSVTAEKIATFFAQTFGVFVPAMDIATLIIGGDVVLDFMYIPDANKNTIKASAGGDGEGIGPVDFNISDIEKDYENLF
jgi:hypothetical protein